MRRARAGACAYCLGKGEMSREHVLPRWARRRLGGYECFVPRRTRPPWDGEPVVTDVCAACNSGPLSRLDKAASRIHLALDAGSTTLDAEDASDLGKWSVKVAYNSHRAVRATAPSGTSPASPPLGRPVGGWRGPVVRRGCGLRCHSSQSSHRPCGNRGRTLRPASVQAEIRVAATERDPACISAVTE